MDIKMTDHYLFCSEKKISQTFSSVLYKMFPITCYYSIMYVVSTKNIQKYSVNFNYIYNIIHFLFRISGKGILYK